jgi:hypothetical protein
VNRDTGFIINLPGNLANYARGRIDAALAVFQQMFDTVKVSVDDEKDDSGWITCQIRVRLVPSGIWIIQESRDKTPYAAIANAAASVARFLGRQLGPPGESQPLATENV